MFQSDVWEYFEKEGLDAHTRTRVLALTLTLARALLFTDEQPVLEIALGVREFFLWGRVRTQSGTDYYVARAENGKRVDHDGVVVANVGAKFYYSQDGMEWLDLVPPEEDVTMEKAAELKCASSSVDRSRVLDLFILAGRRAPRLR